MNHLLTIDPSVIDWSRAQFALTAIYHWLFVPLTLGLAVVMGIIETIYYRSGAKQHASGSASSESISLWAWPQASSLSLSLAPTGATTHGLWATSLVRHWPWRASWPSSWRAPS